MNLQTLTDDQLHTATVTAAKREREETINLLKHLSEIERRRLFSKFNCDSLHAYCVNYLKMSDPHAGRRVSASRLLNELPVIEEKVRSGAMTLTSLCQANTFFRKEAAAGNKIAGKEKLELINKLEGQVSRRVEQILLSKSDQPEIHLIETVKQKTEQLTEIKLLVDEETLNKLNRLKEIYSHQMPNATYAQIISKLATIGLEKIDPDLKAKRAEARRAKTDLNRNSISSSKGSGASKKYSVASKIDPEAYTKIMGGVDPYAEGTWVAGTLLRASDSEIKKRKIIDEILRKAKSGQKYEDAESFIDELIRMIQQPSSPGHPTNMIANKTQSEHLKNSI